MLLVASVGFLGFSSLSVATFVPLAAFLFFGFVSLRLMQFGATQFFAPLVTIAIVAFVWLKKYTFIPDSLYSRSSLCNTGPVLYLLSRSPLDHRFALASFELASSH